jgi:hypothetical protein
MAEAQGATLDSSISPVEQRKAQAAERAQKARRRQDLELQREHILGQRTSNPYRRTALATALAEIESQLEIL